MVKLTVATGVHVSLLSILTNKPIVEKQNHQDISVRITALEKRVVCIVPWWTALHAEVQVMDLASMNMKDPDSKTQIQMTTGLTSVASRCNPAGRPGRIWPPPQGK